MKVEAGTLRMTILLAGMNAVGPATAGLLLSSIPDIGRALNAKIDTVMLALTLYLLGFAVGQTFYGPLSDAVGRKPMLKIGIVLYILASIACAFAPNIETLIAARCVQGLGAAGPIIIARAMVRDMYSGAAAARELGLMNGMVGVATITAPAIGAVLQVQFGWRSSFFAMICFGLCLTLSAWLLLPETAKDVKGRKSYSFGAIIASYGTVLKNASYRKSMTILVSAYLGVFAFTSSSPYIMQTLLGLSPLQYGMTQITTSIGYMAGNLVGARFSHRITQRSMIRIGSGIMVVAISTQAIVYSFMPHSAFALIAFQAIMLFGNGLLVPQIIAAAVTPFPDRAGAATSLLGFTQMAVAAIIGTFLANMLGQTAWPVIVTGLVTVSIIVAKIYVWPGDKPDVK